jgi:hypothetical protein
LAGRPEEQGWLKKSVSFTFFMQRQTQELTTLRDCLLPMLMNGQVTV